MKEFVCKILDTSVQCISSAAQLVMIDGPHFKFDGMLFIMLLTLHNF